MIRRFFSGVVASVVMALAFVLVSAIPAAAECVPIPNDIWSAPVELIVYSFWFTFPDVMQYCAYQLGTYDSWPLIQCVVSMSCAWG